jgi:hypothetical protein
MYELTIIIIRKSLTIKWKFGRLYSYGSPRKFGFPKSQTNHSKEMFYFLTNIQQWLHTSVWNFSKLRQSTSASQGHILCYKNTYSSAIRYSKFWLIIKILASFSAYLVHLEFTNELLFCTISCRHLRWVVRPMRNLQTEGPPLVAFPQLLI